MPIIYFYSLLHSQYSSANQKSGVIYTMVQYHVQHHGVVCNVCICVCFEKLCTWENALVELTLLPIIFSVLHSVPNVLQWV